jgi:hypothetical protein
VDTWHKCPIHAPDAPHPEDYSFADFEDDPGPELAPVQPGGFAPDYPDFEDDDLPF